MRGRRSHRLGSARLRSRHGRVDHPPRQVRQDRQLPLHPTTGAALRRYLACRDQRGMRENPGAVHLDRGHSTSSTDVQCTFQRWSAKPGSCRVRRCRPRMHDLRHASPSPPCSMVPRRRDTQRGSHCCRRTSVMPSPPAATGTCPRLPNCLPRRPSGSSDRPGDSGMSALATTLQAFFTDRLIRERHASPHTVAAYRDTLRLLLGFAAEAHRQTPPAAGHRGHRRAADLRVPGPPRAGARQHRAHPQRSARRDPLAVPLRRIASSRARHRHRAGASDPAQASRPAHRTFLADRKPKRYWPPRTGPPGSGGAITLASRRYANGTAGL